MCKEGFIKGLIKVSGEMDNEDNHNWQNENMQEGVQIIGFVLYEFSCTFLSFLKKNIQEYEFNLKLFFVLKK